MESVKLVNCNSRHLTWVFNSELGNRSFHPPFIVQTLMVFQGHRVIIKGKKFFELQLEKLFSFSTADQLCSITAVIQLRHATQDMSGFLFLFSQIHRDYPIFMVTATQTYELMIGLPSSALQEPNWVNLPVRTACLSEITEKQDFH